MIPVGRAIVDGVYSKFVGVFGSQQSKTETMLNIMGHGLDDAPAPVMYLGPTRNWVENVFDKRFRAMVDNCESLKAKKKPGKQERKTNKEIAGVTVRFAWAGSASEIAGDPARIVFVDERDRMDDDVGGEGDPVEVADARRITYVDGITVVFSSPTEGTVDEEIVNGLEFWKPINLQDDNELLRSATWKLFQQGTRRHWAVPCPDCSEYFIPRFKQLWWPHQEDGHSCSPEDARKGVRLVCFCCGALIDQGHKEDMAQSGRYVAPGQMIDTAGNATGAAPYSTIDSYWASGLMSTWNDWGRLVEKWLLSVRSGDPGRVQAVINTGFGELYSVKGKAPTDEAVGALRMPYELGGLVGEPTNVLMGVDVQKDCLYYTVRAFGLDMESWQVDHGTLLGDTDEDEVWNDLARFRNVQYDGKPISRCFIDSGYRAQFVYGFCRGRRGWAFPTKGRDTIASAPLSHSKLDSAPNGKRFGLGLWLLNTDFFKTWIHERIERDPKLPGGFHLAENTSEDYCRQLVSEARVEKPSGKSVWVKVRTANHYLDAEVNVVAAAYSLNMQTLVSEPPTSPPAGEESPPIVQPPDRGGRRNPYGGWFNR